MFYADRNLRPCTILEYTLTTFPKSLMQIETTKRTSTELRAVKEGPCNETASKMYYENSLRIPTMYMYSNNDIISLPDAPFQSIPFQKDVPSFFHEFDTPHVQHFKNYPEKYMQLLDNFLDFIKIKDQP